LEKEMRENNRYYRRSRIPEETFRQIVFHFAADESATSVARMTGLTRKSVNNIFQKIRRRIAEHEERSSPLSAAQSQGNDSLSCTRCTCGRCRKGISVNTPLFALLTEQGQVFAAEVPDCRKPLLRAMIRGKLRPANLPVNGWHGYDALVDAEFHRPFVVRRAGASYGQAQDAAALLDGAVRAGEDGVDGIETFWSFARQRLQKFNGIPRRTFYLHLKETEWRFNQGRVDAVDRLLQLIEGHPL
jgi:transposase